MLIRKNKNRAFTIVELLTVMSIIIILISLLLPALQRVRQFASEVRQQAQFHSLRAGIDMFYNENGEYPPSDQLDSDDESYCGAMKLAEAMVGQDLLGYHPDSIFRANGFDAADKPLYLKEDVDETELKPDSLNVRKGPYIELDQSGAKRMGQIYSDFGDFGTDANEIFVLTDVFEKRVIGGDGGKHGMPILYYKASDTGNANPNEEWQSIVDDPGQDRRRIYRHEDNDDLVQLGVPFDASADYHHPMDGAESTVQELLEAFYYRINNDQIKLENGRPYRPDSYILLSAGVDGLYGTRDDIYNFQD